MGKHPPVDVVIKQYGTPSDLFQFQIANLILHYLENGYVKRELDKKNITDEKRRRSRFHQWLTDFGKDKLLIQLGRVMAIMELSTTMSAFKRKIAQQKVLSVAPELFDDLDVLDKLNSNISQL